MTLARWEPITNPMSLRQAMDRLFEDAWVRSGPMGAGARYAPIDLAEDQQGYAVKLAVPGINPDDIEVNVIGNVLTFKVDTKQDQEQESKDYTYHIREIHTGGFERRIELPTAVEADNATTSYEHGILTLHLPKAAAARPRRIQIGTPQRELAGTHA